MTSTRSLRAVVHVLVACSLICQAFAVDGTVDEEDTCVQGLAPAKRTLQATQRNNQRVVMSSAEQVRHS